VQGEYYINAFKIALKGGYKQVVKLLLDTGKAKIYEATSDGWTPLLLAI
jgi:ankyrin repeat protein